MYCSWLWNNTELSSGKHISFSGGDRKWTVLGKFQKVLQLNSKQEITIVQNQQPQKAHRTNLPEVIRCGI